MEGFVAKSLTHFNDNKADANEVADARLAPDMLPFRFQIHSTVHHSLGAIQGVKAGVFAPPPRRAGARLRRAAEAGERGARGSCRS